MSESNKHNDRLQRLGLAGGPRENTSNSDATTEFYVAKCVNNKYNAQLLLLAKAAHLRGDASKNEFKKFVQLLRRDTNESNRSLHICRWLSRHYLFQTVVELDEALATLDCSFVETLSNADLQLFAEFLVSDGIVPADYFSTEDRTNTQFLCSKVVEALAYIPTIDEQSSVDARRLDSLLTVAEPLLPDSDLFAQQIDALKWQKSLWPVARSLQEDVDQACAHYFDSDATDVSAFAGLASHERSQILEQIASVFFDTQVINAALYGDEQTDKQQTQESKQEKHKKEERRERYEDAVVEMSEVLEKTALSILGTRAQSGKMGEQQRRSVVLCLLLAHPIIRNAMKDVGPVKHLTDDTISRLRRAESKHARLFRQKPRPARSSSLGIGNWLWQQAQYVLGSAASTESADVQWNTAKKLLYASVAAMLLLPSAAAAAAPVPTSPATGLVSAQSNIQSSAQQLPSAGYGALEVVSREKEGEREAGSLVLQTTGFITPATLPAEAASSLYEEQIDVLPITRLLTSVVPYGASLQTRFLKRNLCSLLGGTSALFGAESGVCTFGETTAKLYDLPNLPSDVRQATDVVKHWLDRFYDVQTTIGRSDEAKVTVVTPNGAALAFMFEPETRQAGAKIIGALTPYLTQIPRRTLHDALEGGEVFFTDPHVKAYSFPPVTDADVKFARMQCKNLMEQYGEAMELHQVLFVSPTLFETPQQFEQRLRATDLFLQRCSADIANISQFIDLCPPSATGERALECELQLQQLQARLLKDVETKRDDEAAWNEWVQYNDYVAGVDSGTNAVAAVTALVRSHISRHRIAERVQEFVQEQLDALNGNTLFEEVVPDQTEQQRTTTEYALLRAYAAGSMVTAWIERLADFASTNTTASLLLLGTPALLLFLYKVLGRKSTEKLSEALQDANMVLREQEKNLADLFLQDEETRDDAKTLADIFTREATAEDDARLLAENEQLQKELAKMTKRLAKMKKSRADWQKNFAAQSVALDRYMNGVHTALAAPSIREQYLQYLTEEKFDMAQALVDKLLSRRELERQSRETAKRLVAMNPEAWQRANDLVYGPEADPIETAKIAKRYEEETMPELMKELIETQSDAMTIYALASVPLSDKPNVYSSQSSESSSSTSLSSSPTQEKRIRLTGTKKQRAAAKAQRAKAEKAEKKQHDHDHESVGCETCLRRQEIAARKVENK